MITYQSILTEFCKRYQKTMVAEDGNRKPTCYLKISRETTSVDNFTNAKCAIEINGLPTFRTQSVHDFSTTATENACSEMLFNLLNYGLEAAHNDLQTAIKNAKELETVATNLNVK